MRGRATSILLLLVAAEPAGATNADPYFFGDDSHPDPFAVNHCSFDFGHAERESQFLDHVTLNIGTGAVDFLTSLEGMKDPHAQDELLASYARAVVGARLQYGDVNLRDGESRGQPVRSSA